MPEWIREACDLKIIELRDNYTVVDIITKPLDMFVPSHDQFAFDTDFSMSGLALFGQSVDQISAEKRDSDYYDEGLLSTVISSKRIFDAGVSSIKLRVCYGDHLRDYFVNEDILKKARILKKLIPPSQHARVSGNIKSISGDFFSLLTPENKAIRCLASRKIRPHQLKDLCKESVIAQGEVIFRPSGRVQMLVVDHLEFSDDLANLWGKVPKPIFGSTSSSIARQPQDPESGINAIIGKWPGEESYEEFCQILEEIS